MAQKLVLTTTIFLADRIAAVTPPGATEAETVLALIELGLKAMEAAPEAVVDHAQKPTDTASETELTRYDLDNLLVPDWD